MANAVKMVMAVALVTAVVVLRAVTTTALADWQPENLLKQQSTLGNSGQR